MSYSSVENQLVTALRDPDLSVIALVGKWGCGKTHLWRTASAGVQHDLTGVRAREPIEISLFGVRTLADLKLQLIQSALLQNAGPDFIAEDLEHAVLTIPLLLRDRLIVIDDVERKHAELSLEELMGFIRLAADRWRARFLLLLNTDRLDEQQVWRTLFEKVVDRQIALAPTPREALAVAFDGADDGLRDRIGQAIERLGLTNIRVIRRIASLLAMLTREIGASSPAVLDRIVPSVALMAAIHLRALPTGPSLEYVVRFDPFEAFMARGERTAQELEWDRFLLRAQINETGRFEVLLQRYLESGSLDRDALRDFVVGLDDDIVARDTRDEARQFLVSARWNIGRKPDQVVEQARRFVTLVDRLPAYLVGAIAQAVGENGGIELERTLIDACLRHFDALAERGLADDSFFAAVGGPLHPRLRDRALRLANDALPQRTLFEAVLIVVEGRGWGEAERKTLLNASPEAFIDAMNRATPVELMQAVTGLLRWMKGLLVTAETEAAHRAFLAGARRVVADSPYSLLARLLVREFTLHGLHQRLKPNEAMPY